MEYQKEFAAEQQYLDRTLGFIRENLAREEAACSDREGADCLGPKRNVGKCLVPRRL